VFSTFFVKIKRPAITDLQNHSCAARIQNFRMNRNSICCKITQDALQLSPKDRAAGCVIVLAKSGRLELGDNFY